ncbi:MAG TPA: type II secretion system protein GspG [bacterium]|nr:type II secretion system protein GspG [bacterium]HPP11548.1 type II secretion system protein GspG [bacterium]
MEDSRSFLSGKKARSSQGMVLAEILVAVAVFMAVVIIAFRLVWQTYQKAKVAAARGQIAQLAAALEACRDDTGLYPVFLSDLLSKESPKMMGRNWHGPYLDKLPLDPWGNQYYYRIPPTTLFSSPAIPRVPGQPDNVSFKIETVAPGIGRLRIENYGVTSCSVYLNGVEVVTEKEFRNSPRPQIIEKEVTLLENNTLTLRARSTPSDYLFTSISGTVPQERYFILGSYGKDRKGGGSGFNADLEWTSNVYPNFTK